MKENEKIISTILVVFLLTIWLGFLVHRSPRFAGSLTGGALAVSGSLLMVFPLVYMVIKRNLKLKKRVVRHVSMRTLLIWHIYAGIVGPILVILHTGHKFASPLGIILTGLTVILVLSGFIGRYLLKQISRSVKADQEKLKDLRASYAYSMGQLVSVAYNQQKRLSPFSNFFKRQWGRFFFQDELEGQEGLEFNHAYRALRLTEAISDMEYAIKSRVYTERIFKKWLPLHITLSFLMYGLMVLHIVAAIYFGIRWFE